MSKTHCRFCDITVEGAYINCPKCGTNLMHPNEPKLPPEDYELADQPPTPQNEEELRQAICAVLQSRWPVRPLSGNGLKLDDATGEIMSLLSTYVAEAMKPHVMPKHRRRSLTPQERSFEAEVASFVRAYPEMSLKEYWLGRWHQKSNLRAANLHPKEPQS